MEKEIEIKGVTIKVDTTPMYRNVVTIRFDNGDYCDIDVKHLRDTAWYLSTSDNVSIKDAFKDELRKGAITITKVN